jgi:hypothetical protein
MSSADCRSCLGSIISAMPQYLSGRQGGRIIGMRCNFRNEVYSFFSGALATSASGATSYAI